MFQTIRRLLTKQNYPIPIIFPNKRSIETPEGYEEEYKPNPDYDKEELENDKK